MTAFYLQAPKHIYIYIYIYIHIYVCIMFVIIHSQLLIYILRFILIVFIRRLQNTHTYTCMYIYIWCSISYIANYSYIFLDSSWLCLFAGSKTSHSMLKTKTSRYSPCFLYFTTLCKGSMLAWMCAQTYAVMRRHMHLCTDICSDICIYVHFRLFAVCHVWLDRCTFDVTCDLIDARSMSRVTW